MIKRFPSRNSRSKGIKVKHVLQICLLLGVCFWLIYQVKHSHDKKKEFDEKDAKIATTRTHDDNELLKLGRKDLHPRLDSAAKNEKAAEDEDDETVAEEEIINGAGDNKHAEELEQELEVTKHEEEEREDVSKHEEEETGDDDDDENNKHDVEEEKKAEEETEVESRGAGDDELDERDQDQLDGEEDLLDEEKEKGREDGEAKEGEVTKEDDKEVHETLPDDEEHEDGSRNSHEAREEHYKGDDASSAVTHDENTDRKDKINDLQGAEVANNNGTGNANEVIQTNSTLHQEQGDMAANNSLREDEVANNNGSGNANEIIQTDSTLQQEHADMASNNSASVLSNGEQTIKDEKIISPPSSENNSTATVTSTVSANVDHQLKRNDLAAANVEAWNNNSSGDSVLVAAIVSDTTSADNATAGGSAIGELSNQESADAEKVNDNETVSGNSQSSNSSSNLESGGDQTVVEHETTGEAERAKSGLPNAHPNENLDENKTESSHSDESGIQAGARHDPIDSSDSSVGQEQEEIAGGGTNIGGGVGNENVTAE